MGVYFNEGMIDKVKSTLAKRKAKKGKKLQDKLVASLDVKKIRSDLVSAFRDIDSEMERALSGSTIFKKYKSRILKNTDDDWYCDVERKYPIPKKGIASIIKELNSIQDLTELKQLDDAIYDALGVRDDNMFVEYSNIEEGRLDIRVFGLNTFNDDDDHPDYDDMQDEFYELVKELDEYAYKLSKKYERSTISIEPDNGSTYYQICMYLNDKN